MLANFGPCLDGKDKGTAFLHQQHTSLCADKRAIIGDDETEVFYEEIQQAMRYIKCGEVVFTTV